MLSKLTTVIVAAVVFTLNMGAALADEFGYGNKWYQICNETQESHVTFYTDETDFEHELELGECDIIWTDYDYITVEYDTSWEDGYQSVNVTVEYPNDLDLINNGYDYFGESIGHYLYQ